MKVRPLFKRQSGLRRVSLAAGLLFTFGPAFTSAAAAADTSAGFAPSASCTTITPAAGFNLAPLQVSTKSSAILGNAVSSLDLIRMQQAPAPTQRSIASIIAEASVFRPRLTPGIDASRAIETDCQQLSTARVVLPTVFGTGSAVPPDPEAFLASKRIRISHTPFDSQWKRVKSDNISRSTFKRLVGGQSSDEEATLGRVNAWVNRQITYTEDRDLFGVDDMWAGARRTLKLRKGDCEDIALLKMQMLAAAGVPRDDMILTIARDLVRQADHAVLVVRTPGGYRLLDNASDTVVDAAPRQDYRAIVSFGAKDTWLHGT